jgi:tetratricopeptide (TPR) repeat protein
VADNRIDDLRRRLQRDPGSRLFAQLAEELRRAGEVDEAISVARAGLERHPAYPSARLTLGRALLDAGDAASARDELESALRGAPDNIRASRLLGEALESLGELGAALDRYRATLEMTPGDGQVERRVRALESRLATGGTPVASGVGPGGPGPSTEGTKLPPTARIQMPQGEGRAGRAPLPPTTGETGRAGWSEPPRSREAEWPTADAGASGAGTPEGVEGLPPTLPLGARTSEFDPRAAGGGAPEAVAGGEKAIRGTGDTGEATVEAARSGESGQPSAPARPLSSATLAELYFKQGLLERAAEVYRQVVAEEPGNENARRRLAQIEADMRESGVQGTAASPGSGEDREARRRALERTIEQLEALLAVVRGMERR